MTAISSDTNDNKMKNILILFKYFNYNSTANANNDNDDDDDESCLHSALKLCLPISLFPILPFPTS